MSTTRIATAVAAAAASIALAAPAHADDYMYAVPTDIPYGEYTYKVTGGDWGSWELCSDTLCDPGKGMLDGDMIDGAGHTGYLTIPRNAKYLKLTNLLVKAR